MAAILPFVYFRRVLVLGFFISGREIFPLASVERLEVPCLRYGSAPSNRSGVGWGHKAPVCSPYQVHWCRRIFCSPCSYGKLEKIFECPLSRDPCDVRFTCGTMLPIFPSQSGASGRPLPHSFGLRAAGRTSSKNFRSRSFVK